ncbi:MAG: type II toxin-antitoxin system prevent-host-death family antitoxin [Merismopedia sp. SIO2A8]|nr:type II toxin-antitoxin system prevent-host-death family antitoxin [Symploca sp. SIO2B6]NET51663.1 type II toxin-antitoxin system prevent-host-death family antitoxin [Merismopedia sp. SIO2A8]
MDTITYTELHGDLLGTINQVCEDRAPVTITRQDEQAVVLVSLDDYRALEETAYLLRSPKNAKRLIDAVLELDAGGGQERELIE